MSREGMEVLRTGAGCGFLYVGFAFSQMPGPGAALCAIITCLAGVLVITMGNK